MGYGSLYISLPFSAKHKGEVLCILENLGLAGNIFEFLVELIDIFAL